MAWPTMSTGALDPLIHDPERLRIVATLAALPDGDALSAARLQDLTGLTPGSQITRLRELDHAGYVRTDKTGDDRAQITTAIVGATGRIGSAVTRGLLDAGHRVRALVRDPGKASRLFGDASGVEIRQTQLADPGALAEGLAGARTAFLAMGSIGREANLQRTAIQAVATVPGFQQLVRLSVLNVGPDSIALGAFLDLVAGVLAELPGTSVDNAPRMADFAKVLSALDQVTGWGTLAEHRPAHVTFDREVP